MERDCINVDGIKFSVDSGTPFSFDGVFSPQKLSGIELSFKVYGSQEKEIENLLKKEKVTVEDPFVGQTYEASTSLKSSSFQVGKEGKSYVIELKQIDVIPPFDTVEIEGTPFKVLQYEESLTSGKVGRNGLLKLSKEEFDLFRKLLEKSSVKFQRVGVDKAPLELRFGGSMYWSQHTEEGKEYFKHIVRLFPLDLEPSKLNLASGSTQAILANMVISLHARFELLVQNLAANKAIPDETKNALLTSGWETMFPTEKIDQLFDSLKEVADAEDFL